AGAFCAIVALAGGSFSLFCGAAVLVGVANAYAQQYRFAAVESASAASAGLAVSITLAGSMVGAVLGPELAARGEWWVEGARFTGTFLAVGCCSLIAGVLLLWLRAPGVAAAPSAAGGARPLREIARNRTFVVAGLGGAAGYGVMAFVMTAAPLAMHVVDGHSLAHTATAIQAHILGMYAPSLVTGFLLSRFGCRPIMLAGAMILGLSVAAGFAGREVTHYGLSMIALGVGWNFLFVGGTTLLGSAHRPEERFRAQAFNDFTVFGLSAVGSLGAGAVMQLYGWHAVLWASVPAIVLVMGVLAWGRRYST
ncbi:MAG: MFS transporter, partial [Gammaproteobacteria bacterium]|nr:MFS transporter [Gammaproteobacteria bacterium]